MALHKSQSCRQLSIIFYAVRISTRIEEYLPTEDHFSCHYFYINIVCASVCCMVMGMDVGIPEHHYTYPLFIVPTPLDTYGCAKVRTHIG